MRVGPIPLKRIGRAVACALVGAVLIATAMRIDRREPTVAAVPPAQTADPLSTELERCRNISKLEDVDDSCRAAWAEARRRFFSPHEPSEARP